MLLINEIEARGLGWVVLRASDKAVISGPHLDRDEAVRADERIRVAKALSQRRERLQKYSDATNDNEWASVQAVIAGIDIALDIVRDGCCPECVGSMMESGGGVCKVCGVDYVTARALTPNQSRKR